MRTIIFLCVLVLSLPAFAQKDEFTYELDALKSPSSSAAGILGVTSSAIQRPEEPVDFIGFLETASGGFTELPTNFAVHVNPTWLLNKHKISFEDYRNDASIWNNMKQTFGLSFASRSQSGESDLRTAVGFNVALKRGKMDAKIEEMMQAQFEVFSLALSEMNQDEQIISLRVQREQARDSGNLDLIRDINTKLENRKEELNEAWQQQHLDTLNFTQFKRSGLFLELAGALETEFPEATFQSKESGRAAGWLTTGLNLGKTSSILAIARYEHDPRLMFTDDNNMSQMDSADVIDAGARYIYDKDKWLLSGEVLVRKFTDHPTEDGTDERWTLNLGYSLGKNTQLKAIFGRDFDGNDLRDGNVLAGLNFFKGLGNKRTITKQN